ncbi:prostaglandin E2 receptor EP3 subtype-like [Saccostrea cucullata]|uniref:prostaglandin E2 receptor EP3 subtype-like n=1 Tax=Saccostrea cuccullata TaxID=36930 RepID=UPI002ED07003
MHGISMENQTIVPYNDCKNSETASWVPPALEFFFGILGNVIAVLLVWINRKDHRWSSFYKMFTALAVTDFMGILLTYPFIIKRYTSRFTYCFSPDVCKFTAFVMVDTHLASAMLIAALSVDRLIVLKNPSLLRAPHAKKRYKVIVVFIWITSSVISMLQLVGVGSVSLYYPGSWCYFNFKEPTGGDLIMSYLYSVIGLLIIFITLISNVVTLRKVCIDPFAKGTLLDSNLVSGYYDHHVMIFILAVTVSFVATWSPLIVDIFLHAAGQRTGAGRLELWFVRLTFLNAIIDPWLYIILRKESVTKLVSLCRLLGSQRPSEQESLLE